MGKSGPGYMYHRLGTLDLEDQRVRLCTRLSSVQVTGYSQQQHQQGGYEENEEGEYEGDGAATHSSQIQFQPVQTGSNVSKIVVTSSVKQV